MKLATVADDHGHHIAAVVERDGETLYLDLRAIDPRLPETMKELLALPEGLTRAAEAVQKAANSGPFLRGKLLAPVPDPQKVICIGLNYSDHAAESGQDIPTEPVCFGKFSSAVIGPEAAIQLPAVCKKVDYEAELVVVIGQRGRCISEADAMKHVAGYTVGHDVSARDWQIGRPGGQWLLGKTPDTFAPLGPWLVTKDEIANPHALKIQLRLNGETLQNSSTEKLIFPIEKLISHLSQLITLEPGDVIFTGTPPGVGAARKPPIWLKGGDVAEVEIEGLGVLRNPIEQL